MSERAATARREQVAVGLLMVFLLLAGAGAWWFGLMMRFDVRPSVLAGIPADLDGWKGEDIPVDETVERILNADFNVSRVYRHTLGNLAWLYVGYYSTDRGGRPEHTPPVCYAAQGWDIEWERAVELDPARGLRVNEMLVRLGPDVRLVHYWYRSQDRTGILGTLGLGLERLRQRLGSGRGDGALVRLSAPVLGEDPVDARRALGGLARGIDPEIGRMWPEETRRR